MTIMMNDTRPPMNCSGYPQVLIPKSISDNVHTEVSFYLPYQNSRIRYAGIPENMPSKLACSLIKANTNVEMCNNMNSMNIDTTKPVIIVCHGLHSWRNQLLIYHLASGLADLGYHTLRFDFEGNGHSVQRNGGLEVKDQFTTRALDCVTQFVQEKLHCRTIAIVGHSRGAEVVMKYAVEQEKKIEKGEVTTENKISAFVNISGTVDTFRIEFDKIKTSSLMTIHGDKDQRHSIEHAHRIADSVTPHELVILKGANHNFNGLKYMQQIVSLIDSFVRRKDVPKLESEKDSKVQIRVATSI